MVGNNYKGFIGAIDHRQQLQKVCRCYRWQVEATKGLQVLQIVDNIYRRSIKGRKQLHEAFWLFFQLCRRQQLEHEDNCYTMVSVAKWQANKKTCIIFMCFHVVFFSLLGNLFLNSFKVYKYVVLQPLLVKGIKCTRGGPMIWENSM